MPVPVILLLIAVVAVLIPSAYLLALTLASFFRGAGDARRVSPSSRFAVLIPAHNEEVLIPRLLESLARLDYPKEMYVVHVAADNCTDATAEIARSYGVNVFERQDREHQGKGYALKWLLSRVAARKKAYDAYVFLDADSLVAPGFLAVMDERLQAGCDVVQGQYIVSNSSETWVSALRHVALVLMHYVRPMGRRALGLSCGLFGTGMVFRSALIDRQGWDAFSLAEDVEYYLKLTDGGIRVEFAPDAILWAEMPSSLKQATHQNLRWERGRLRMAYTYGLRFLLEGVFRRNWLKLDAGLEQLIPPLSATFMAAAVLLVLTALTGRVWLMVIAAAANAALIGHLVLGLASARAPLQLYSAFLFLPGFVLWKTWVYLRALMPGEVRWTRTERRRQ